MKQRKPRPATGGATVSGAVFVRAIRNRRCSVAAGNRRRSDRRSNERADGGNRRRGSPADRASPDPRHTSINRAVHSRPYRSHLWQPISSMARCWATRPRVISVSMKAALPSSCAAMPTRLLTTRLVAYGAAGRQLALSRLREQIFLRPPCRCLRCQLAQTAGATAMLCC